MRTLAFYPIENTKILANFTLHCNVLQMELAALTAKHLIILCCYGGTPFVDLHAASHLKQKHQSTHIVDPTDWIAVDTSGIFFFLLLIVFTLPQNPIRTPYYNMDRSESCEGFNLGDYLLTGIDRTAFFMAELGRYRLLSSGKVTDY